MDCAFDINLKTRKFLKSFIENLSLSELNKVPDGFNNNIIWNIAHVIVTQQLLVYNLSGLPTIVSNEMIDSYRKGTKPLRDLNQAEVDAISNLLFSTLEKTKDDYDSKLFQTYNQYTVTTKNTISNIEEAIEFNNFHEGIHLGYILALRKSI